MGMSFSIITTSNDDVGSNCLDMSKTALLFISFHKVFVFIVLDKDNRVDSVVVTVQTM